MSSNMLERNSKMVLASVLVLMIEQVPKMTAPSVCISRMTSSCLLLPWNALQNHQVRCDPGSFQLTTFALSPRACEILCAPVKSGVPVSLSPLGVLKVNSADLQSHMFWGLMFLMQDPWTRDPDVGHGLSPLYL